MGKRTSQWLGLCRCVMSRVEQSADIRPGQKRKRRKKYWLRHVGPENAIGFGPLRFLALCFLAVTWVCFQLWIERYGNAVFGPASPRYVLPGGDAYIAENWGWFSDRYWKTIWYKDRLISPSVVEFVCANSEGVCMYDWDQDVDHVFEYDTQTLAEHGSDEFKVIMERTGIGSLRGGYIRNESVCHFGLGLLLYDHRYGLGYPDFSEPR